MAPRDPPLSGVNAFRGGLSHFQNSHAIFEGIWKQLKDDPSRVPDAEIRIIVEYLVSKQLDRVMGSPLQHYTEMVICEDNEAVIKIMSKGRANAGIYTGRKRSRRIGYTIRFE